jgi:hypothetical protein
MTTRRGFSHCRRRVNSTRGPSPTTRTVQSERLAIRPIAGLVGAISPRSHFAWQEVGARHGRPSGGVLRTRMVGVPRAEIHGTLHVAASARCDRTWQ